jgi:hypothetical protein
MEEVNLMKTDEGDFNNKFRMEVTGASNIDVDEEILKEK